MPLLTPRQLEALRIMRDEDEELVYERGECWVGEEQFSAQTFFALLRAVAISADSLNNPGHGLERYRINDRGILFLAERHL